MNSEQLLILAINGALKAGKTVLQIYETNFNSELKSDNTPVTLADKESSRIISKVLSVSNIPLISEEEKIADFEVRKSWPRHWLVDPLDGTKEFIKRNGEFAINIALIENKLPVIGVIYAPVKKEIYFARKGIGSFKSCFLEKLPEFIDVDFLNLAVKLPLQKLPKNYTVIASKSHLSKEINLHLEKLKNMYGKVELINIGSSIKQCLVAEGMAHEYPRFGKTMEWDTAAGQCILEQSGSKLIDLSTALEMRYNKLSLENNYFIAKHLA